jgi:hypothetical protein
VWTVIALMLSGAVRPQQVLCVGADGHRELEGVYAECCRHEAASVDLAGEPSVCADAHDRCFDISLSPLSLAPNDKPPEDRGFAAPLATPPYNLGDLPESFVASAPQPPPPSRAGSRLIVVLLC